MRLLVDEIHVLNGGPSKETRSLVDEMARRGRTRPDPSRSPEMLELLKTPQTTTGLDLTDEQMDLMERTAEMIRSTPGYRPNMRLATTVHTEEDLAAATAPERPKESQ